MPKELSADAQVALRLMEITKELQQIAAKLVEPETKDIASKKPTEFAFSRKKKGRVTQTS